MEITFFGYFANVNQWLTGIIATIALRYIYKRIYTRKLSLTKIILIILILSFLFAFVLFCLAHLVYFIFTPYQLSERIAVAFSSRNIVFRMTQLFPIMTAWSMLYFVIKFWFDISTEREKAQKSDYLAQTAQLQMLRYQVNPHFLFNSFSSLRALIRSNPKAAIEMVSKLSEFYRYSLITKSGSKVPLNDEIEAIKYYAEIEKIRFDEKIEFEFLIDDAAGIVLVPSFIVHPLIENAIKYGMKTSKLPLKIKIEAAAAGKVLSIIVSNSGRWIKPQTGFNEDSTKTGLENIRNRLAIIYPDKHKFNVFEEDGFVKAVLEINLEAE